MRANKLIEGLRDIEVDHSLSENHESIVDEVVQSLMEFDELKKVIHDTVDPLIELYSFLFSVTGEFE